MFSGYYGPFKKVILYLSKKIIKKCTKNKIWSASMFYYEDLVEQFGTTVRILKNGDKDVDHN